jgi:hypothetical protein
MGGLPGEEMDTKESPEMSNLQMGNKGKDRIVNVESNMLSKFIDVPAIKKIEGFSVPANNNLAVMVADWNAANLNVEKHPF